MVLRHVIRICGVLTHATIQFSVRADAIPLIADFCEFLCDTQIHLLTGIGVRHGVILFVKGHVVVQLYSRHFPGGELVWIFWA